MLVLPFILASFLLVGGIVVALGLRSVRLAEARTFARLHDPAVDHVVYDVPEGVDPAVLQATLHHDGFTSVAEQDRGQEHLLVECGPKDRARVRRLIQTTTESRYGGLGLRDGAVLFVDEV
jgi:hypothetical protein